MNAFRFQPRETDEDIKVILHRCVALSGLLLTVDLGRPLRFWLVAEYLLLWTKSGSTPPLVTTGPALPAELPSCCRNTVGRSKR